MAARHRRRPAALLVAGSMVAALVGTVAMDSRRDGFERWRDGTVHGPWLAVFDGHGQNGALDGLITMSPKASTGPSETHAGLIVTRAAYGDLGLLLWMRTVRQLRTPRPNPWEVAWVIWGYTDPGRFYYLILKPNGWELGKRDPAYPGGQRFLMTGGSRYPAGQWYSVRVVHRAATASVWANGRRLVTYTDTERPYLRGSVGLYTEDASVEFRSIVLGPAAPTARGA